MGSYRYSYSMARRQFSEGNLTTLIVRIAIVMILAVWCVVQLHWTIAGPDAMREPLHPLMAPSAGYGRLIRSSLDITEEVLEYFPKKPAYSYTTDERLMQDAVEASRRVSTTSKPKIAFLFLVRGEIPFEPLWRRFFAGQEDRYSLYVHTTPNFTFPRSSFFYGKQIPSRRVERLSRSLADAVRRLVAMALVDTENQNTWFVNLCEATIPLRSSMRRTGILRVAGRVSCNRFSRWLDIGGL